MRRSLKPKAIDVLTASNRYALIYRVGAVKRVEIRERGIVDLVAILARHETPTPRKRAPKRPPDRTADARSEDRRNLLEIVRF